MTDLTLIDKTLLIYHGWFTSLTVISHLYLPMMISGNELNQPIDWYQCSSDALVKNKKKDLLATNLSKCFFSTILSATIIQQQLNPVSHTLTDISAGLVLFIISLTPFLSTYRWNISGLFFSSPLNATLTNSKSPFLSVADDSILAIYSVS